MSHPVADVFRQAAALNTDDDRRRGNVVYLEEGSFVIATGDIHGNRDGLKRIIGAARLTGESSTRLILHELIHGPVDAQTGRDQSIEVLHRAAELKIAHPREVVFLLGNHDVAELTGNEISRAGQPSCKVFAAGVRSLYNGEADEVIDAMKAFLRSLPLAVMCPNNVMLSHSLPSPGRVSQECFDVLDRQPYRPEDLRRGGGAYEWTWGRRHTEEMVAELGKKLNVDYFIMGHILCPEGFEQVGSQVLILACDHDRGCILPFSTARPVTCESARTAITPLASLAGA